ncbi:MAG TPA: hypothetical protein VIJ86_03350 [Acidimicrobiales bacterium]
MRKTVSRPRGTHTLVVLPIHRLTFLALSMPVRDIEKNAERHPWSENYWGASIVVLFDWSGWSEKRGLGPVLVASKLQVMLSVSNSPRMNTSYETNLAVNRVK